MKKYEYVIMSVRLSVLQYQANLMTTLRFGGTLGLLIKCEQQCHISCNTLNSRSRTLASRKFRSHQVHVTEFFKGT